MAIADDIIVCDGDCDYRILSQEEKLISLSNGKRIQSTDFIVPNAIHLTSESTKIYDVSWVGFQKTTNVSETYDGSHYYYRDGYRSESEKGNTLTCKFKTNGSITFKLSMKIPHNGVYKSYIEMKYDSQLIKSYYDYSLSMSSYFFPTDEITITPGDNNEHMVSFYLYVGHYKDEISIDASIKQNANIDDGEYKVVEIDENAFEGCTSIQTITLQDNISSLNNNIFLNGCLNKIDSHNIIPPTASSMTFNGVDKENTKIFVPLKSMELYKNAEGWKDFHNDCFSPFIVEPTSISLNKNTTNLIEGKSEKLIASFTPDDVTETKLTWSSSTPKVATVSNGVISALSIGKTTITVTTSNGKTSTCVVNVLEDIVKTVKKFRTTYAEILDKTAIQVTSSDLSVINKALDDYGELSDEAKDELVTEKNILESLKLKAEELKVAEEADAVATIEANNFKAENAEILGKNTSNIVASDLALINKALDDYSKLSEAAKMKLINDEKGLLDSLKAKADDLNMPQCATPNILYENGRLCFSCMTEGAKYHYTLQTSGESTGEVDLGNYSVKVTVYSTAEGYKQSKRISKTIELKAGDVDGNGSINISDVTKLVNIILNK